MKRLFGLLTLVLATTAWAAGEIQFDDPATTGQTLYVIIKNQSGNALTTGTTFGTYTTTRADFDQALTEVGVTGLFTFNYPAVAAGNYFWTIYQDANDDATPSHTDDLALAEGNGYWAGTAFGVDARAWAGAATATDDIALIAATAAIFSTNERAQILAALSLSADIGIPKALTWKIKRLDGHIKGVAPIVKDPDESPIEAAADFTDVLADNDAILTVNEIVVESGSGLTIGANSIWMNSKVRVFLSAGTDGVTYRLRVKVTTVSGQVLVGNCEVIVDND